MADEPTETTKVVTEEFVEAQACYWHREGTNDYKNDGIDIDKIVDRAGQTVEPVWEEDWTTISPGIESRREPTRLCVRIHRHACPVRILFRSWHEYVSYDWAEHCSQHHRFYWIRYEASPGE